MANFLVLGGKYRIDLQEIAAVITSDNDPTVLELRGGSRIVLAGVGRTTHRVLRDQVLAEMAKTNTFYQAAPVEG